MRLLSSNIIGPTVKMARSKMSRAQRTLAQKEKIAKMNAKRLATTESTAAAAPNPTNGLDKPVAANGNNNGLPNSQPLSATRRKLSYFSRAPCAAAETRSQLPTTIMNLNLLQALFRGLQCTSCASPTLSLEEGKGSRAFAVHLKVVCSDCGHVNNEVNPSSSKVNVNRSVVAAGITVGLRLAGINKLSESLGMPGIHHKTYQNYSDEIYSSTPAVEERILHQSRDIVRKAYQDENPSALSQDGILSLAVSFDGSWPKRGHTSKLGFGAVVDTLTGLVVDFHVMSTYCQTCASTGQRLKKVADNARYEEWLKGHKEAGKCLQNYTGSSGGMECAAALVLWRRSTTHNMQYTSLVGDGDTKTFSALKAAMPYGEDFPIVKEECVNHVSKRLNTGLRNLKATLTKKSIKIGGNAKGSLTDVKIGLLQSYYTKAVRTHNSSVEEMSSAIWAGFYHSVEDHKNCPVGMDSWCWYQRDIARGVAAPERDRKQSTFMNSTVAEHVKQVYQRLTNPSLLGHCLLGKTQNTNESLHSLIWLRCPKHLWSGYKRVFMARLLGVGEYNMGSLATRLFLEGVNCPVSSQAEVLGSRRDRKRLRNSDAAMEQVAKKRREKRKQGQQQEREATEAAEGGPSYIPGGF